MARTDHRSSHHDRWSNAATAEPAVVEARSLTTAEAARLLHVSSATLLAWQQEFGLPTALTPNGSPARYPVAELLVLRRALSASASIASAMQTVRHRLAPPP